MRMAIYPGSFDPVTLGHVDIIERGSRLFDHVVVAVLQNVRKEPLFNAEERVDMTRMSVAHLANVSVDFFPGLLVNYLRDRQARIIIRGLRAVSDFETELQYASMNKELMPECETVFIPTDHEFSYLSSSIVKEIARHGGEVGRFVPTCVQSALAKRFHGLSGEMKGRPSDRV